MKHYRIYFSNDRGRYFSTQATSLARAIEQARAAYPCVTYGRQAPTVLKSERLP